MEPLTGGRESRAGEAACELAPGGREHPFSGRKQTLPAARAASVFEPKATFARRMRWSLLIPNSRSLYVGHNRQVYPKRHPPPLVDALACLVLGVIGMEWRSRGSIMSDSDRN
jgi:hypothetical protein